MSYRWPVLDLYEVPDQDALVAKCLELLGGLPIGEQFRIRRITTLIARPLLVNGILATGELHGLYLLFSSETDVREASLTIAHELGHTFELNRDPFVRFVELDDASLDASEDFAEAFGLRWLSRYGIELEEFIRRSFTLPSKERQVMRLK